MYMPLDLASGSVYDGPMDDDGKKKNVPPPLVERELTGADLEAIERALATKRPLGWVHAMGIARRLKELEVENERLQAELEGRPEVEVRGMIGIHKRGKGW